MSKKVVWSDPKLPSKPAGQYATYAEFAAKANERLAQQQEAQALMAKCMPAMLKLLEIKMVNGEPLNVVRPLNYMSDEMHKSYNSLGEATGAQFKSVRKTIGAGTKLLFKSFDSVLGEFIFTDTRSGEEHAITSDQRNALLTQTDIFETIRDLINKQGE